MCACLLQINLIMLRYLKVQTLFLKISCYFYPKFSFHFFDKKQLIYITLNIIDQFLVTIRYKANKNTLNI